MLTQRPDPEGGAGAHLGSRMSDLLTLADVQHISIEDGPIYRSPLPSKLQATPAAARPIIGAPADDAADSGAGLVTRPGHTGAFADAICTSRVAGPEGLLAMGRSRCAHYGATYSDQSVGGRLEALPSAAAEDNS